MRCHKLILDKIYPNFNEKVTFGNVKAVVTVYSMGVSTIRKKAWLSLLLIPTNFHSGFRAKIQKNCELVLTRRYK